jgi:uncharacterized protein YaaW (UPF0174 family)
MYDPNLTDLLKSCSNEDLDPLVGYLLNAATNSLDTNEYFKSNRPNHSNYVLELVEEIQTFGGNTIANLFRGGGVYYDEILDDVCSKSGVKDYEGGSVAQRELKLLAKILEQTLENMAPEERRKTEEQLREAFQKSGGAHADHGAGVPVALLLAQGGVQVAGFAAYQMAVIVANAVAKMVLGRGLTLVGNAALTRVIGLVAGPIGIALTALWTVIDIAGPAFRVTLPCVCHVAYLRLKKQAEAMGQI